MADIPTVLILGGGHSELPLIDAARQEGYRVVTTGNDESGLGHQQADEVRFADYSDVQAMVHLAADLEVSAVVAGCNDFAAISATHVADYLGFPGHDSPATALRIHHKDQFRRLLDELGLPTPRAVALTDASEAPKACLGMGFPVIVKPVDLSGGKGIAVCSTPAEAERAVRSALALSREDHVIVEQFLVGSRHGFSCFVEGGRVTFWFADDERYHANQYLVGGTATPSTLPPSAITSLVDAVEVIWLHLGLVDGLMHVQCILTDDGPIIVELCRRCPGDLYPVFVTLSTEFDFAGSVVRSELGIPLDIPGDSTVRPVARHCLTGDREGRLQSITIDPRLRAAMVEELTWWKPGEVVRNHLVDKFGIVFFAFDDVAEMRRSESSFPSSITVDIEEATVTPSSVAGAEHAT